MPDRVAVIAVHGVGHHEPREAARAAADLLAFSNPKAYSPFVEAPLRIPVTRVEPGSAPAARPPRKRGKVFDERPSFIADAVKDSKDAADAKRDHPPVAASPELAYMREQLSGYELENDDRVYDTVSLTSIRKDPATARETEVHVYDMYWTDISRVSTTGLKVIGELYQLLFYVCGLGRHTIDFACLSKPNDRSWAALATLQKHAERLLVLWIPVVNLCALGLGVIVIPQKIYALRNPWAIWGTASLLLIGFFLMTAIAMRRFSPGWSWPWYFWVSLIAGPLLGMVVFAIPQVMPIVLALAFWAAVSAAILAVMAQYEKRRPGAVVAGAISVAVVALMLACPIIRHSVGASNIDELGLRAGAWLYGIMHGFWSAFVTLAIVVSVLGLWLAYRKGATLEDKRAVWTANLALTLPGLLVLTLNLGLWRGVLKLSDKLLDASTADGIRGLIDVGTPWAFGPLLAVAIVAFLLVVWCLLPSIFSELFPKVAATKNSVALGVGLSQGFRWMRVAGEGIRLIVVAGLPITLLLSLYHAVEQEWVGKVAAISRDSTLWVGLLLIAMIAGPGPFRALAMGLRTGIDVAIDVANWLRLHPRKHNPRSQICARYTSLLRNILDYRASDGKGFDRIVIFSHSQGTVISSELLRFLHLNGDQLSRDLAERKPILFTMGCPLRQLYSQRFPLQYAWGRHEAAAWPGDKPEPAELNITQWVNAYRSGDYVGRHLWLPDGPGAWQVQEKATDTRVEVCIAAGAHTHYWDDSAPEVARHLDALVGR
jgi:hypothetical protein